MKKVLKRSLLCLLAITIIFGSAYVGLSEVDFSGLFGIKSHAASVDDLEFELNDDGSSYRVVDCNYYATGDLVIPETYNGLPVTEISECAVYSASLTSVTIPKTITTIYFPPFGEFLNGQEIYVDSRNEQYSSENGVLYDKSKTTLFSYPRKKQDSSFVVPDTVRDICAGAFAHTWYLRSVVLPDSVTFIAENTFSGSSISSVTMGNRVETIGNYAFENCTNLTDVYYGGTQSDWENITIGSDNSCLTNATIHYHEHTYSTDWIVDVEPTCTQTGSQHKICLSCGDVVTENIPAIDHNYSTEWTIDVEPTCTEGGSKSRHCTACGDKADVTSIEASGHNYSTEWTIDVEPTQTSEGEKSRHCENCSDRTDITVIPRLINDSVAYIQTDGVLCNGEISYIVKLKAGDKLKGAIFGAVFDPEVLEPIDEKSGGYTITDSYGDEALNVNGIYVAGLKYGSDDTYVVGHINMTELDIASDTEYMVFTFKVKDFSASEAAVDFYCVEFNGTPEIEHNDYEVAISYCNNEIVSFDHTISAEWKIEKEADAVEDGLQYKDCTVCGEVLETEEIPQTVCEKPVIASVEQAEGGLVVTWDSVHGADLYDLYRKTDSNWVKISQLTSENTSYTDAAVVNDTEYSYAVKAINEVGESQLSDIVSKVYHVHTMGDWLVRVAPTCTEYGESYKKCAGCEYEETDVIEPTGHSYSTEWTVDVEPTCTEEGIKSHHCTACGDKADVTSIDSLGHDYDNGVVTKSATCEEDGVIAFTCTRKGCTASYTDVVPAIGHDYDTGRVILPATCEEDGTMRYSCENEGCLSYYDEVITKLGHNMDNGAIVKEPTCIAEGEKVYKCRNAGCIHEVTEAIEMVEHSYSDIWSIDVEATCTENGSKSHHCTVCGDKADITEIVATGHSYVLKSTLSSHPHTSTYICSVCDDEKSETNTQSGCIECSFTITPIDSTGYKLVSYIGSETDVTIPTEYNGRAITSIANACFRGNTTITSVKIADGVTSIGSLAFMNCKALERVYIPSSVTSIGAQAFYGFTGTIYCVSGSTAHEYAAANNIAYVLVSITETENTEIDYDNLVIRTTVQNCGDITEILGVAQSAIAIPTASYIYGNIELFGTGTIITVFDGNEYIGDFTLVVEGDTNGDSVCDALDAWQVSLASNGHTTLDGVYSMAADSNEDDVVDINDYQSIVNKAVS